jgi:hypothetical protein
MTEEEKGEEGVKGLKRGHGKERTIWIICTEMQKEAPHPLWEEFPGMSFLSYPYSASLADELVGSWKGIVKIIGRHPGFGEFLAPFKEHLFPQIKEREGGVEALSRLPEPGTIKPFDTILLLGYALQQLRYKRLCGECGQEIGGLYYHWARSLHVAQ